MEIELKFQVPVTQQKKLQQALQPDTAQRIQLHAKYFDTPARLLAQEGMALRLRKEGEDWVQTFKATAGSHLHRIEAEVDLGLCSEEPTLPDLGLFVQQPEIQQLLEKTLTDQIGTLQLQFETDIERTYRIFNFENAEIEVCLDQGEIRSQDRKVSVYEVEFELKQGPVASLIRFAQSWADQYQLWLDVRSKAERGNLLALDLPVSKAVHAQSVQLAKKDPDDTVLKTMISNSLDQILPNLAAIAAGVAEPAHIHQARVGLRRLRSILKTFKVETIDPVWQQNLAELAKPLGILRDQHIVETEILPQILQRPGVPQVHLTASQQQIQHAEKMLRSTIAMHTLLDLLAYVHEDSAHPASTPPEFKAQAERALKKIHQQVSSQAIEFLELTPKAQHQLRRKIKQLRYSAESVASLYAEKKVRHYLKLLHAVQDTLGYYQDLVIAERILSATAQQEPGAWYAAGWVNARQEFARQQAARTLADFSKAQPFWL